LQRLHQAILRGDPISATDEQSTQRGSGFVRPAQLPADCVTFSGRTNQLSRLDDTLREQTGAVIISAIAGTAGVGKTTLAVHWAHQAADRFPDGQLYVNLRGFDPGGAVTTAAEAALELYREAGFRPGQAHALNAAGWYLSQLGDHRRALGYCQEALTLHEELADLPGKAGTLDSIGYIHHQLGEYQQAIVNYREAVEAFRDYGERYFVAETLDHLGDSHHLAGDVDAASTAWRQAVEIFEDLGHADANQVAAKLRDLAAAVGR
jgi:tetratricopeptide (TPR) repeat protein